MSVQEDVLQGMRDVFVAVTGVSAAKVIPADDKGPRPAKPYWTIKVTAASAGNQGSTERVNGLLTTYTVVIATASDGETYGLNLTSPSTASISYTSGVGADAAEISEGLADAWNADATCVAAAVADGTTTPGTVTISNLTTGGTYALVEDENAAKMTTSSTSAPMAAMRARRDATVSIQGYGTGSLEVLDAFELDLDSPASLTAQAAASLSLVSFGGVVDISTLLDTGIEPRGSLEVRARHLLLGSSAAQTELLSAVVSGDATRYSTDPDPLSIAGSYP